MWTREKLKTTAKADLKGFYWLSFAVCIVASILEGGISGSGGFSGFGSGSGSFLGNNGNDIISPIVSLAMLFTFLFVFLFMIAFVTFIGYPIMVGKSRFFIHLREEDRTMVTLFSLFKKESYLPVVKTLFLTNLFIFLWSLLFIIPGIIKSYSYRMVPYILSENPTMHYREVLGLSQSMTDGQKFQMFILDLSFIGWILLGTLACGVGVLFVLPYIEATWAQFYFVMRRKAMDP